MRCLDYTIDMLVTDDLHWKEHQKAARAAKVEYIDGKEIYQVNLRGKGKPTPELLAIVKKCQWWEDHYVMLNGLSKEEFNKTMRKWSEKTGNKSLLN